MHVSSSTVLYFNQNRQELRASRKGNGHDRAKMRRFTTGEKASMRTRFVAANGQLDDDQTVEWTRKFNDAGSKSRPLSAFQVPGFVAYLHGQVSTGELTLRDPGSYRSFLDARRALYPGRYPELANRARAVSPNAPTQAAASKALLSMGTSAPKQFPIPRDFLDEVRYMTRSICRDLNYWGEPEDIMQAFYLNKILRKNLLTKYNPTKAKASTWLFKVIRNVVIGQMAAESLGKHAEMMYASGREGPEFDAQSYDPVWSCKAVSMDVHESLKPNAWSTNCGIDPDYLSTLKRNGDSDDIDGLAFEFRNFEHMFMKSSDCKKYSFDRRKNQGVKTSGGTLVDIFRLFYEGYTSHEIAEMHGVTDMTLCHLKRKLAGTLRRYGFEPNVPFQQVEAEPAYA